MPLNLHRGAQCSLLYADTHFSLLSPSLGLALTSGTTRIPATQTRMWWKTILRCSIVSGLELGLSCSKVVASACGCWSSLYPTVSEGWFCFIQASGNRETPLRERGIKQKPVSLSIIFILNATVLTHMDME